MRDFDEIDPHDVDVEDLVGDGRRRRLGPLSTLAVWVATGCILGGLATEGQQQIDGTDEVSAQAHAALDLGAGVNDLDTPEEREVFKAWNESHPGGLIRARTKDGQKDVAFASGREGEATAQADESSEQTREGARDGAALGGLLALLGIEGRRLDKKDPGKWMRTETTIHGLPLHEPDDAEPSVSQEESVSGEKADDDGLPPASKPRQPSAAPHAVSAPALRDGDLSDMSGMGTYANDRQVEDEQALGVSSLLGLPTDEAVARQAALDAHVNSQKGSLDSGDGTLREVWQNWRKKRAGRS